MAPEDKISKLLKLKRYEQPPEGYFDEFLLEFQARQRAEVIHRSLWDIISDRAAAFASTFEVPRMAYAATAAIALVSASVIFINPSSESSPALASNESLSLSSPQSVSIGESRPAMLTSTGSPSVHYVLPTRPVSYASARSF